MLCAIFAGACTASPLPESTETPVETATEEATPTVTTQPSPDDITPTPEPTREQPAAMSITPCQQGTILFTARTKTVENLMGTGSLYSVCADGTGLREIISNDELAYSELDISPDGQSLALSGWHLESTGITVLSVASIEGLLFSDLVHGTARFDPQWSADGEYLAYLLHDPTPSETPPETHIEITHLKSGTVSEIHLAGLGDFDWSPDSSKAVFGTWVAPDEHSFEEFTAFLGDIECDDAKKLCELAQVSEIPNVGRDASWIPGSQMLVSVITRFGENGNNYILVITDIEGNIIQEIVSPLPPDWPRGSPDGRYIGFVGNSDLYIVDLNEMSVQRIVFTSRERFHEIISFRWMTPVSD